MNKLEELKKLREQVNLTVKNLDNYPKGETNVIVANHNCLMDIFYLPMSLPEEIVSLISARLVYKNENDRKDTINKYLCAIPIEAHGGSMYVKMCLDQAQKFLINKKSVAIFPEGAYVSDRKIFRGHTGASRIIYNTRNMGQQVNLVPISIYVSKDNDLDSYNKIGENVKINILPSINYEEAYYNYRQTQNKEEMNMLLHQPIDCAMQCIAHDLDIPYENNYIKLRVKGNVMFDDGSVIAVDKAQSDVFIKKYSKGLNDRCLKLLKN